MDNRVLQSAILGVVTYAQMYLESGAREPEMIQDANNALKQFMPMAQIVAQIVELARENRTGR